MSDPIDEETRQALTECALSDPNLSPALNRLTESLFENGFHLELEPKNKTSDGLELYQKPLETLYTWTQNKQLLEIMRDSRLVSFVQGRNATMMLPGILELPVGGLPEIVETVFADDLGEVLVDVSTTRNIVAVATKLEGKKFCRADEMVYVVDGVKKGLRRDGRYYGIPQIESILVISQILKRIYNYDAAQAVTAAYMGKILFQVSNEGDTEELKGRTEKLMQDYTKTGSVAFATFDNVVPTTVENTISWQTITTIEDNLARLQLSVTGVPSSMMNREQNLNRDLATIQAIQFIKFVRKPAEKLISKFFEDQMLTPLLAHLTNKTVSELPVRVKIKSNLEEELQTLSDPVADKQQVELQETPIETTQNTPNVFGAAGNNEYDITKNKDGSYIVKPNK